MNKTEYQKYIKQITPKSNKIKNSLIAFIFGGLLSVICQFIYNILLLNFNNSISFSLTIILLIFLTSFITCVGIGDEIFSKLQCALIIPITGFAHSISSSIIDYKKEGLITIGSNAFKLAGSVILYGITSSIILVLIKVIIIDKF